MRADELRRLYDYHYWASAKLMTAVGQLSPEQFTQDVAGSFGSVRNTLVHIVSAEWGYLERCGGQPRGDRLKPEDYPTLHSVLDLQGRVEGHVRPFLTQLGDADCARPIEFTFGSGPKTMPLSELLEQGALHAIHHRGQAAMLVRMLGGTPGNFDFLFFAGN